MIDYKGRKDVMWSFFQKYKKKKKQRTFAITSKKLSLSIISFQVDFADNKADAANTFQIERAWGRTMILWEFYKLFHPRDS